MNAIQFLKEDHQHVRQLLHELQATTPEAITKRRALVTRLRADLKMHTTLEEELFYPAVREAAKGEMDVLYFEALEEHRAIQEFLLPDLLSTDPGSEKFSGRAKILKELIEHHLHEEEQEIFARAKTLMDNVALRDLGHQMLARRQDILTGETQPNPLLHPLDTVTRIGGQIVRGGANVLREAAGVVAAVTHIKRDPHDHQR